VVREIYSSHSPDSIAFLNVYYSAKFIAVYLNGTQEDGETGVFEAEESISR
jgi:hypothetical protein